MYEYLPLKVSMNHKTFRAIIASLQLKAIMTSSLSLHSFAMWKLYVVLHYELICPNHSALVISIKVHSRRLCKQVMDTEVVSPLSFCYSPSKVPTAAKFSSQWPRITIYFARNGYYFSWKLHCALPLLVYLTNWGKRKCVTFRLD